MHWNSKVAAPILTLLSLALQTTSQAWHRLHHCTRKKVRSACTCSRSTVLLEGSALIQSCIRSFEVCKAVISTAFMSAQRSDDVPILLQPVLLDSCPLRCGLDCKHTILCRICDGAVQDPFQQEVEWWVADRWCQANARRPGPGDSISLDTGLMQEAAACLQGQRCFAAFRDPSERLPGSTIRHVWHVQVSIARWT